MKKTAGKLKRQLLHNKRGLSLVELIVAVMIIMITIAGSIHGLTISYRSVLMGAQKDDAQAVAQRDCDIIMSIISKQAESGNLDSVLNGDNFTDAFFTTVQDDTQLETSTMAYDRDQYDVLLQGEGTTGFSTDKKSRFVHMEKKLRTISGKQYDTYLVTVTTYYNTVRGAYITCSGEINVEHP